MRNHLLNLVLLSSVALCDFQVDQVANPNWQGRNGTKALLQALLKHKLPIPAPLQNKIQDPKSAVLTDGDLASTQNGTEPNLPTQFDSEYVCNVDIDGQTIVMDFDTGSSDFWVFSTQMPASQRIGQQAVFNASASPNFVMVAGERWSIAYLDGSGASGNVGVAPVNIGGATVTNQAIELATSVSPSFAQNTGSAGLVGLAFSSINTIRPDRANTFFANVYTSLSLPVFTADLNYHAPGSYNFGYIDTTKFSGELFYTPVQSSNGFWQFDGVGFTVGTTQYNETLSALVVDTGTTLLVLQPDIVDAYYSAVPSASYSDEYGAYIFPCSAISTLPDLYINIGSGALSDNGGARYSARISRNYMIYGQIDPVNCYGALQSSGTSEQGILGDIFFNSQFVVFDAVGNGFEPRVGFAYKNSAPKKARNGRKRN